MTCTRGQFFRAIGLRIELPDNAREVLEIGRGESIERDDA